MKRKRDGEVEENAVPPVMKKAKVSDLTERVTERQNQLTKEIDKGNPVDMLRYLCLCDGQMFSGYQAYPNVYTPKHIESIITIGKRMKGVIEKNGKIIAGGCGTSGRLGWVCGKNYNRVLKKNCFDYLMAGGDKALIVSQEAQEDYPVLGADELKKTNPAMFIGITCGLSAPYVAGQLYWGWEKNIETVLMGFNPIELSRKTMLWEGRTFYDVAKILDRHKEKCHIINPVVGPEGIGGSSRMKGGSMTKILMDTIFAVSQLPSNLTQKQYVQNTWKFLNQFEVTYRYAYLQNKEKLGKICKDCGDALSSENGHIYYIGADESGILGIIDASECVPTYGALHSDIRGFMVGGWDKMKNHDSDMPKHGEPFNINVENFMSNFLPKLSSDDVVVILNMESNSKSETSYLQKKLYPALKNSKAKQYVIYISGMAETEGEKGWKSSGLKEPQFLHYRLQRMEILPGLDSFGTFCLKLLLNNISTTAHVLKGVTISNIMINLRLSNTKLVTRATKMVSKLCGSPLEVSRKALMTTIYDGDYSKSLGKSDTDHVLVAAHVDKVVPTSMLLVSGKAKSIPEARELLKNEPILRNLIKTLM